MKRFALLALLSLLPLAASAQASDFAVEGGALVWRRVYSKATTTEAVVRNLLASGLFKDVQASGDIVTAELRGLSLEYKSLGYTRMELPIYLVNDKFSAFVTVQVREGRYRATVERIKMYSRNYGESTIESQAVKGGALAPKFQGAPARIVGHNLDSILSQLDKNTANDDW